MSWNHKVVWSDGMFLQPQHLQQHDRYLQATLERRAGALRPYAWGFTSLRLDESLLVMGKIGLLSASGVLPDGTPFCVDADDSPPVPLDVPDKARDARVVLALPLRRPGVPETDAQPGPGGLARFQAIEIETIDSNADGSGPAPVEVGKLRLRLAMEHEVANGHACLGVAKVIERRPDNALVLAADYAPPCLDFRVAPKLAGFVDELAALLRQRGDALAQRLSAPGGAGSGELQDFLLLQSLNRALPAMRHAAAIAGLHPEDLYRQVAGLAGELATFSRADKRAVDYPAYRHDHLDETFAPVMVDLRQALSMVMDSAVLRIALEARRFGVHVAVVADRSLFDSAGFVLAVNAQLPAENLRRAFPQQVKVGPVEKIRDLVNLQLNGIALMPLPIAPRQLPFHAGFSYFELDRNSEFWKQLPSSSGFALHVGGEFPGLQMELWAIRR